MRQHENNYNNESYAGKRSYIFSNVRAHKRKKTVVHSESDGNKYTSIDT